MITRDMFRNALRMATQIGSEKVANSEKKVGIKGAFDYGIIGELKEELTAMDIDVSTLTENEKDAIVYAFCVGWNNEVINQ